MKIVITPGEEVVGVDLEGEDLSRRDLTGVTFVDCKMSGVNLSDCNLTGSKFLGVTMRGAIAPNANFTDTQWDTVFAEGSKFYAAKFVNGKMNVCCLEEAELQGADVRGLELNNVSLKNARMIPIVSDGVYIKHVKVEPFSATYTAHQLQIGCKIFPIQTWFSMRPEQIQELDPKAYEEWEKWRKTLAYKILGEPCRPTRNTYNDFSR